MKINFSPNAAWILVVVLLFGVVYQLSGTPAYVDGDDATSMAYHLLGRDDRLQEPYSPYHGMTDKLLSVFPPEEGILQSIAFGITRVANAFMIILILLLTFDWLDRDKQYSGASRVLIAVAVLMAVPEVFYLGLTYSPSLVAMCSILSAHLFLRRAYRDGKGESKNHQIAFWIAALILFGFGVAFRWNSVIYGLIIVADLFIIQSTSKPLRERLLNAAGWGVIALLASLFMIILSGYGLTDIVAKLETAVRVSNQAGTLVIGAETSNQEVLMRAILTLSPMLSPTFALFTLVGTLKIVLDRDRRGLVILAGLLGILPWIRSGVPKFLITCLPILILGFVHGLTIIGDYLESKRLEKTFRPIIVLGLILPWIVGVRVDRGNTAWGPGFELKPYNYAEIEGTQFAITIGPGMAFPTPEGPRPLYGHGFVLMEEWKDFINDRAAERQLAIDTALRLDAPLLTTAWSPDYYLVNSYSMGFYTTDPHNRRAADTYFHERRFINSQGQTFSVLYHEVEGGDIQELIDHLKLYAVSRQIVLVGYPKTLHALQGNYPSAIQALGPLSATIELSELDSE